MDGEHRALNGREMEQVKYGGVTWIQGSDCNHVSEIQWLLDAQQGKRLIRGRLICSNMLLFDGRMLWNE